MPLLGGHVMNVRPDELSCLLAILLITMWGASIGIILPLCLAAFLRHTDNYRQSRIIRNKCKPCGMTVVTNEDGRFDSHLLGEQMQLGEI